MTTLAHDARAPLEITPVEGMILCRLGPTRVKLGNVFGPTEVTLFKVTSVEEGWITAVSLDRPRVSERHRLALPGGVLRLAASPNKVSFTYVAPSMREMRARFT